MDFFFFFQYMAMTDSNPILMADADKITDVRIYIFVF